ncbi:MAG: alpha/beta hydrolase [Firmicutes bacterium]|nr:alpha/beta hydrolase [Bacillota bacterium]
MKKITYTNLLNRTLELLKKSGSLKAYNYITENAYKVKGNKAQIFNFRYALASASGLEREALNIMREAIIKKGFWYSYDYLTKDEDLKPLYKYNEFKDMINLCKIREEKAKKSLESKIKIVNNKGNKERKPLFISLHGNQENIELTEDYWKSVTDKFTLALPQSSQIEFSDAYNWEDLCKGTDEVKRHFKNIIKNYNIDLDNIIIGGFSAGCRVALNLLLNDNIKAKGFIFVSPWLPELNEWKSLIKKLKEKDIKGFIICGDKDEDCYECSKDFVSLLEKENIKHEFKIIKDLDHDYPNDFEDILNGAIKFIINK